MYMTSTDVKRHTLTYTKCILAFGKHWRTQMTATDLQKCNIVNSILLHVLAGIPPPFLVCPVLQNVEESTVNITLHLQPGIDKMLFIFRRKINNDWILFIFCLQFNLFFRLITRGAYFMKKLHLSPQLCTVYTLYRLQGVYGTGLYDFVFNLRSQIFIDCKDKADKVVLFSFVSTCLHTNH